MTALKPARNLFSVLLMGALAALLVLLAIFQYRWLGQISTVERGELQTTLRNRALDFQSEFQREIGRLRSVFDVGRGPPQNDVGKELAARYAEWKDSASYPGLVRAVFVARSSGDESLELLRLNENTGRLEEANWGTSFPDLWRRLERFERLVLSNEEPTNARTEDLIPASLPLLVQTTFAFGSREEITGVVIVTLDPDFMKGSLFPALAKHNFTDNGLVDCDVTVVDRSNPGEPIFNTGQPIALEQPRAQVREAASVTSLGLKIDSFGIDSAELERKRVFEMRGSLERGEAFTKSEIERKRQMEVRLKFKRPVEHTEMEYWRPTAGQLLESVRRENWQALFSYGPGKLEAAVTAARRRNLAISFGILSLLAVSIIMIFVNARRAQRLAQQQMDFVAGVSHEFRTPLAVIHAISENLADGLIKEAQQIEECGVVIRNDVRRLSGMVEEVLELAGAFRGKSLYQPQAVDLAGLIDDVLARYPALESGAGWMIERRIEHGLPSVLADPTALASAVRNIIDNAIKYGDAGRWIGIEARSRVSGEAGKVEVTIADKGPGIPESEIGHIFEPFYRGREVVAAQIHGNGLGLSLVRNIVEAHSGTVTVASTPGEGSSFTLTLPAVNGHLGTTQGS